MSQKSGDYLKQHHVKTTFQADGSWVILDSIEKNIKGKVESLGTPLFEWDIKINYGIKTGFNEAFIINGAKKDELIAEDPISAEIIRPILRGRDIKRYGYRFADLYLICTFPSRSYDIDNFPAVKRHLLTFGKERLEQSGESYFINGEKFTARKKTNNKWFETQDSISYWEDFSKQRFIWTAVNAEYRFCSLDEEIYYNNSIFHGVSDLAKGISSILNSATMQFYLQIISSDQYQYGGKEMFVKLPLPVHIENRLYEDEELFLFYGFSTEERKLISSVLKPK